MKDLTAKQTAKKLEHFIEGKSVSIFITERNRMYNHTFNDEGVVNDKSVSILSDSYCLITKEYKTFREALKEALELMKEF